MASVREDVLAFRHFPVSHWRMLWSTNLLEQDEHWQTEGRRMACLDSMAAISPSADALPETEREPALNPPPPPDRLLEEVHPGTSFRLSS